MGESPRYECLNVLLIQTSILRENQGENWPYLCNVLHGIDFLCT